MRSAASGRLEQHRAFERAELARAEPAHRALAGDAPDFRRRPQVGRAAPGRVPVVALHDAAVAGVADDRAIDVVPRAAVAAGKAVRVRVDEFRFVPRDRRAFGVGEAAIHGQRGGLGFAAERDRVLDGELPRIVEVEIGECRARAARDPRARPPGSSAVKRAMASALPTAAWMASGGEVGGARVAAALAEIDGDADALVAVVGDSLDFAAAHGDALADAPATRRSPPPSRRPPCAAASTASATRSISAVGSGKRSSPPRRAASATRSRGRARWIRAGVKAVIERLCGGIATAQRGDGLERGYHSKGCAPECPVATPYPTTFRQNDATARRTRPPPPARRHERRRRPGRRRARRTLPPSKTRRKAEMHALQDMGEVLVGLDPKRLAELAAEAGAAGPARRCDRRSAVDHRLGRPQAAAPVRRQADARRRSGADPAPARPVGARSRRRRRAPARARAMARPAPRRTGGARSPGGDRGRGSTVRAFAR